MTLRLGKLPDRVPVRLTVTLTPDAAAALADYARIYCDTYGGDEKPEALVPAMIDHFLANDAGFKRARRALHTSASKGD